MIKPGYSKYQIAIGRYSYGSDISSQYVANGIYQYDLNNMLTLNSSIILSKNYISGLLGGGFNLPFGVLETDITLSRAKINDQSKSGVSLHGSYSYIFEKSATYLSLSVYRYLLENYYTLDEVMK